MKNKEHENMSKKEMPENKEMESLHNKMEKQHEKMMNDMMKGDIGMSNKKM